MTAEMFMGNTEFNNKYKFGRARGCLVFLISQFCANSVSDAFYRQKWAKFSFEHDRPAIICCYRRASSLAVLGSFLTRHAAAQPKPNADAIAKGDDE